MFQSLMCADFEKMGHLYFILRYFYNCENNF